MAKGAGGLIAGVITLVIGGVMYSVSNQDVINNFSEETGMSQQAAEAYVNNIPEDEMVSFGEIGSEFIAEGQDILVIVNDIDCFEYIYEWESDSLSCDQGKKQMRTFAESEIALGNAYRVLSSNSAGDSDINAVIRGIDTVNKNYDLAIIRKLLDPADIDEAKKTNLYNKSLLKAALESK